MEKVDIVDSCITQEKIEGADPSRIENLSIRTKRTHGEIKITAFPRLSVFLFESDTPCSIQLYDLPSLKKVILTGPIECTGKVGHSFELLQLRRGAIFKDLHSSIRISLQGSKFLSLPRIEVPELTRCLSVSEVEDCAGIDSVIRSIGRLPELYLRRVFFEDWSWLVRIPHLEKLTIMDCGEIDSLDFLLYQKKLKYLNLGGGTTIVSGDFRNIKMLSDIEFLLFKNRLSYNARLRKYDGKLESFSMKNTD